MNLKNALVASLALASAMTATAATNDFVVQTKKLGAPIQSTMYGIFFEDINFAADGGLYAEMIKNRSFEFPQRLMGWTAFGKFEVLEQGGFSAAGSGVQGKCACAFRNTLRVYRAESRGDPFRRAEACGRLRSAEHTDVRVYSAFAYIDHQLRSQ